jgi:ribosome-associated protein
VLDLRQISDAADFFVIASGTSDTHVRTLAERVQEMVERGGGHAHHAEGVRAGRWALLDFVSVVVHVFHPTLREYYQLERLWSDAPTLTVDISEAESDGSTTRARRTPGATRPSRSG